MNKKIKNMNHLVSIFYSFMNSFSKKPTEKNKIEHNTSNLQEESYYDCKGRYISKGVYENKIVVVKSPSLVPWSKTKKCVVWFNKYEPIDDSIEFVSLQIRDDLNAEYVKEINESDGIIATCIYYNEPYYRYGFIPKD
jgi:hypothetical protein